MPKVPHVPTDEEAARRSVEPYLDLTPLERLEVFASLLHDMDVLLNGRIPVEAPDDPPLRIDGRTRRLAALRDLPALAAAISTAGSTGHGQSVKSSAG